MPLKLPSLFFKLLTNVDIKGPTIMLWDGDMKDLDNKTIFLASAFKIK